VQKSLATAAGFSYDTKSSMHFEKGKKTEIETFTGYVVREGKQLNVETPLNDQVYAALQARIQ